MNTDQKKPKKSLYLVFLIVSVLLLLELLPTLYPQKLYESGEIPFTPMIMPTRTYSAQSTESFSPTPTLVAEYFVALHGDDSNPGTEKLPWRTIQKAADTLKGGEIVYVLEGEYDERVSVENSGINIKAYGQVLMRGFEVDGNTNSITGFIISDSSNEAGLWIRGDNNLILENEIYHMKQDGIWFFGDGNIFIGNYIHDILSPSRGGDPHADCFQTWGPATNIVFDGNLCVHNRTSGSNQILMLESIDPPVNNIIFKNNIFIMDDPGYSPMNFHRKTGQGPITDITIVNNNFIHRVGVGQYGIRLVSIDKVTIQNNLFVDYGNGYFPYIWLEKEVTDLVVGYNAVYKTDGIEPNLGPNDHDLWMLDPKFVDYQNLDFSLLPGSPLIDSGISVENAIDYDRLARPQGDGFDIGAFEFSGN